MQDPTKERERRLKNYINEIIILYYIQIVVRTNSRKYLEGENLLHSKAVTNQNAIKDKKRDHSIALRLCPFLLHNTSFKLL